MKKPENRESASRIGDLVASLIPQPDTVTRRQDIGSEILRRERLVRRQELIKRLQSVIPPLFAAAHIRNLNPAFRQRLLDYPRAGLVMFGPAGTGKSYALCALARYLITTGKSVKRVSYENLCLQIRDTYSHSVRSELDIIRPLIDCGNLIIEDIGAGRGIEKAETDFNIRTILFIIDSRIEQCRPTFISTNKSEKNLCDSFDERIASRLRLFKWLGVGGKDKRNMQGNKL